MYEWLQIGVELVNGFIGHLYTRLGTTSNYSVTTNIYNSQSTTAPAKPFPACCVFTIRSLAMASNSGDSSASCAQDLSSQTPIQNWLGRPLQDNSSARTTQKHPVSNCTCIVAHRFIPAGTCLLSHCLEMSLVYLPISPLSHSNGSPRYNM
jgi:hypothetical protein